MSRTAALDGAIISADCGALCCPPFVHNYLLSLRDLKNRYILMRHPRSRPNQTDLLLTNPRRAVREGDLADGAPLELVQTLQWAVDKALIPLKPLIVTSPFLRTRRAASIAARFLGAEEPRLSAALRERNFGALDGLTYRDVYPRIRSLDRENPFHRYAGVESVASVAARTTLKVFHLERRYSGETFLLMSHHETCQILMRCFAQDDLGSYADVGLIPNCAVIPLSLAHQASQRQGKPDGILEDRSGT